MPAFHNHSRRRATGQGDQGPERPDARPIQAGEPLHRVLELASQEDVARGLARHLLQRACRAEFQHRSGREPFATISITSATARHLAGLLHGLVRRVEARDGGPT